MLHSAQTHPRIMGSHADFLICCVLLIVFSDIHGLKLSMTRNPGHEVCGQLQCLNEAVVGGKFFSTVGMTIYNITDRNTKFELASASLNTEKLYAAPSKNKSLEVRGNISRYHASLVLDFHDKIDCLNGSFRCELIYLDITGKVNMIIGNITNQTTQITVYPPEVEEQLKELKQNNTVLNQELTDKNQVIHNLTSNITLTSMAADDQKRELDIKDKKLNELKQNNTIVKEKLTDTENKLNEVKQNNTILKEKLTDTENKLNEVKQNNTILKEKLTDTENKLNEVKQNNAILKEKLTDTENKLNEVKQNNAILKEKLTDTENKLNEVKQNNAILKEKLTDTENKLNEVKQNNAILKEELTDTENKLNEVKQNNAILKEKLTDTENKLNEVKQNNTILKKNLTDTEKELNRTRQKCKDQKCEDIKKFTCTKGKSNTCLGGQFLLWGRILAVCDINTDQGGWVIIQRRIKGDVDFNRSWTDYKNGFGTPDTDFWIGNDIIHNLTLHGYNELRIDLEYNGKKYFAKYSSFSIGNELSNYKLSVNWNNGDANDSLGYHNGMMFSTFDKDNDDATDRHCSKDNAGGWWYGNCRHANLNGRWGLKDDAGVIWETLSKEKSVNSTEMKIRHVQLNKT